MTYPDILRDAVSLIESYYSTTHPTVPHLRALADRIDQMVKRDEASRAITSMLFVEDLCAPLSDP